MISGMMKPMLLVCAAIGLSFVAALAFEVVRPVPARLHPLLERNCPSCNKVSQSVEPDALFWKCMHCGKSHLFRKETGDDEYNWE